MAQKHAEATSVGWRFPNTFCVRPSVGHGGVHPPKGRAVTFANASEDSSDPTHESAGGPDAGRATVRKHPRI